MARININKLHALAKSKGLDAPKISRKADLGQATVYRIWSGEVTDPGVQTLAAIASALGMTLSDLIEEIVDENILAPYSVSVV